MSEFIMNTSSDTSKVIQDKELKLKVAAAAGNNTTTVTKDVVVSTVTESTAVSAEGVEKEAAAVTNTEETTVADESAAMEGVVAEEGSVDLPAEDVVTDVIVGDGVVVEPVPVFDGMPGGDFNIGGDMYMDPTMETGMAEVKDPLLSSWPFVIGISAAVLIVSMALGALLARRKIKKGIELYED